MDLILQRSTVRSGNPWGSPATQWCRAASIGLLDIQALRHMGSSRNQGRFQGPFDKGAHGS